MCVGGFGGCGCINKLGGDKRDIGGFELKLPEQLKKYNFE